MEEELKYLRFTLKSDEGPLEGEAFQKDNELIVRIKRPPNETGILKHITIGSALDPEVHIKVESYKSEQEAASGGGGTSIRVY